AAVRRAGRGGKGAWGGHRWSPSPPVPGSRRGSARGPAPLAGGAGACPRRHCLSLPARSAWTGGDRAVLVGAEGEDRAVRGGSRAAPHAGHSPNTSIAVWQNAFRSSGLRLVTSLFGPASQVTTSSFTQVAPALRRSVRRLGQDVMVRPRTTSASISVHGAWQIAATGLPSWKNALANSTAFGSMRRKSGLATPPGSTSAS